jgi:hypothetical protein
VNLVKIHLSNLDDPIGYVLNLLRRIALVLESIQTNPKTSIVLIYRENDRAVDAFYRDVNVAWTLLRDAVVEVGNVKSDPAAKHAQLVESLKHGVDVSQNTINLFDDLCVRYDIPAREPFLFTSIGRILHP